MSPRPIHGIGCTIGSARVRRAIARVLRAVRRHPRDWARLRRRVRAFRYLATEDDMTAGQWIGDPADELRLRPRPDDPGTWARQGQEGHLGAGWIELSRRAARLPWPRLVALVAHECGHAVTRAREFDQRSGLIDEWASELCADRHAFRWGFEREVRADAPHRFFGHHAALPGELIWLNDEAFTVDRHFYLRRWPTEVRVEP